MIIWLDVKNRWLARQTLWYENSPDHGRRFLYRNKFDNQPRTAYIFPVKTTIIITSRVVIESFFRPCRFNWKKKKKQIIRAAITIEIRSIWMSIGDDSYLVRYRICLRRTIWRMRPKRLGNWAASLVYSLVYTTAETPQKNKNKKN